MKFSTFIAASTAAAPAFALPQFLPGLGGGALTGGSDLTGGNTNGNWTPQEWIAPGSTDCKSSQLKSTNSILTFYLSSWPLSRP